MTGFNTINDPRAQLAQLLQQPAPVTMPPHAAGFTPTQTQYANGGAGAQNSSPLLGGALQFLGKGATRNAVTSPSPTLWPQLNNASFMNGTSPGQIMFSQGMPGSSEAAFNGGAWLGGGMAPDLVGGGADAAALNGGAWLGGGDAALGAGAGVGALAGGGAADGIAATIAADPELLALLFA